MYNVYDSPKNPITGHFKSIFNYRWLLFELIRVEFKLRYQSSFLGIIWMVLNPLLTAMVLFFVFRNVFQIRSINEVDFFSYVYSGVLILAFFTSALMDGSLQLRNNSSLLQRVNVPGETFVLAKIFSNLINFCISYAVLVLYMVLTNQDFSIAALEVIPLTFSLVLNTFALALLLSTLFSHFLDFEHLLRIFLMLLFYITPVFYSLEAITGISREILQFNPIFYYLEIFRGSLGIVSYDNFLFVVVSSAFGIVLLTIALRVFNNRHWKLAFAQ